MIGQPYDDGQEAREKMDLYTQSYGTPRFELKTNLINSLLWLCIDFIRNVFII